jgi:hypothetical protein
MRERKICLFPVSVTAEAFHTISPFGSFVQATGCTIFYTFGDK